MGLKVLLGKKGKKPPGKGSGRKYEKIESHFLLISKTLIAGRGDKM